MRRSRPGEDLNLLDRIGFHSLDPQAKRPAEADIVVALIRELPRERLELDASVPVLASGHAGGARFQCPLNQSSTLVQPNWQGCDRSLAVSRAVPGQFSWR